MMILSLFESNFKFSFQKKKEVMEAAKKELPYTFEGMWIQIKRANLCSIHILLKKKVSNQICFICTKIKARTLLHFALYSATLYSNL